MSQDISEDEAGRLIENRTKFKLYAAEQHFKNLKNLEQNDITIHSPKGRVEWEMEIESFLFHLIGVSDSLVAKTNDKLGLNLGVGKVRIEIMEPLLNKLNEGGLLSNLGRFDKEPWFHKLREWRNRVTHEKLMYTQIRPNTDGEPEVYFVDDPKKKLVIPLLENALQNVKRLVQDIMNSDSRLR